MSPVSSPRILASVKSIDVHPKINDDFAQQTFFGGIISAIAAIAMVFLFISELNIYLTTTTKHELLVDTERGERIKINFDISFPMMPCSWISLDAMDISGELKFDLVLFSSNANIDCCFQDHEVYKQRLDPESGKTIGDRQHHDIVSGKHLEGDHIHNKSCGGCYGAEDRFFKGEQKGIHCCSTCQEVRDAYQARKWDILPDSMVLQCRHEKHAEDVEEAVIGEGCQLKGSLRVNKVAGNFHFAPGHSFQRGSIHIHDLKPFENKTIDFTHQINHLSFGDKYPGMHNPLDGVLIHQRNVHNPENRSGMFQYFLKVVPTTYFNLEKKELKTNQYSVTEHFQRQRSIDEHQLPGVFFFYDLSPIKVHVREEKESFARFLTTLCAIIGGVFTVSGIIDGIIFHSHNALKRKIEIGKFH